MSLTIEALLQIQREIIACRKDIGMVALQVSLVYDALKEMKQETDKRKKGSDLEGLGRRGNSSD